MAAHLGVEHESDALGRHLRPVLQLDAGVRLLRRRNDEDLRRDRVAVRPEHHEEAVFDHGAYQTEIERPSVGEPGWRSDLPYAAGAPSGSASPGDHDGSWKGNPIAMTCPLAVVIALRGMAKRERTEITLDGQA